MGKGGVWERRGGARGGGREGAGLWMGNGPGLRKHPKD